MNYKTLLTSVLYGVLLSACVTINIYFPAAAAEDAARVIVRDVLNEDVPPKTEATEEQSSSIITNHTPSLAEVVLNIFLSPAHAEADININTPAIATLRGSMKQRSSQLKVFYANGAVGLTSNADIQIRDQSLVPLKQRNTVKKLVADENRDRKALYAEIARANNHPEWEADIRATFARVWVEEVPAGTWYQANGSWTQK